ncbi:hypothetical protein OROHE_001238 [Orobanche hederae]
MPMEPPLADLMRQSLFFVLPFLLACGPVPPLKDLREPIFFLAST